jgi:CRISPR/Cas system-associated exonuclease Cas4 (RecB family)
MSSIAALAQSIQRGEVLIPLLKAFLVKERQILERNGMRDRDIVIKDAELSIDAFLARKEEYNHREKLEGQFFHPSALGTCLRQMWFGAMRAPTDGDPTGTDLLRQYMIFETGTYKHILFQNLCQRAGVLLTREVAIKSQGKKLLGHADGILKIDGSKYLLEFKTANSRQYSMIREPKEGHKKQAMAYMRVLKLKAAIIVYENKDTGQLKEYVVVFDLNYYKKEVRKRVKRYFRHVDEKTIPPREGNQANLFPCTYCQWRQVCWDTFVLKKWMKQNGVKLPINENKEKKKKALYD